MEYQRRNIQLTIEYDGSHFHGWQRQRDLLTVQSVIEDRLSEMMGRKVTLYGAGRTDSGVHARAQIANFWGDSRFQGEQWSRILNFHLPRAVRIVESREVPDSFHAQKQALSKLYEYRVLYRRCPSALDSRVHFYPRILDWNRVREALPYFLGEHDFRSFQGAKATVVSTVRTITRFELFEEGSLVYRFEVEGNGFLKQMVRTMVGTALEVGEGKRQPSDITKIIAARDRRAAGRTAPPEGLCLVKIHYPETPNLVS